MIGKRRFVVVLVSVVLLIAVEMVTVVRAQTPVGLSAQGCIAIVAIIGAYCGFDSTAKKAKYAAGGPAEAAANP
ncbi:MAG TPA: hypothetical protein PLL30_17145 [Candidatus Krumholzibacteria bacterium]|nr:hypothetical protein [Candidatus Krumholzibacteria bacterium]HRY42288.1 hypothetical protein [Candidatus Krumholzibacteria bacterium]